MIVDRIENIETYLGINDYLDIAISVIRQGEYTEWDLGRHEIKGDNVFCNKVHLETTKEASWERHENYLDIHMVIDGGERIRYSERAFVLDWSEFDEKGDYSIAPYSDVGLDIKLEPGWFFIAFPQDAHMPGLRDGACFCDKCIFKVKYENTNTP